MQRIFRGTPRVNVMLLFFTEMSVGMGNREGVWEGKGVSYGMTGGKL